MLAVLLVAVSVGLSNLAASIGLGAGGADRRTRLRVAVIFGLFEGGMPVAGLALGAAVAGPLGRAAPRAGAALLVAVGAWILTQAIRSRNASARNASARNASAGDANAGNASAGDANAGDASAGDASAGDASARDAGARDRAAAPDGRRAGVSTGRLLVTGLALSIDNLAAGFAAGTFPVGLAAAAVTIGLVSTAMSLAGLELGSWLGARLGAGPGAARGAPGANRGEVIAGLALIAVGAAVAAGIL